MFLNPLGQGPEAPLAPSTTFTVLLCRRPATAVAWYSPGRTRRPVTPQPGDEVRRFQETLSAAGALLVSTVSRDLAALGQSAELQTRWSPSATTTATDPVPILNRHGRRWLDTARTVKRGVLPG